MVLLPGVSVSPSARGGVPAPVVVRARLVLLPAVLVVVLGEAPDLLRPAQRDGSQSRLWTVTDGVMFSKVSKAIVGCVKRRKSVAKLKNPAVALENMILNKVGVLHFCLHS